MESIGVTPLAGVWIEIGKTIVFYTKNKVTPLAGVWIEIISQLNVITM